MAVAHPRSTPEAKTVPETRSCLVAVWRDFICSSMHRDQFGFVEPRGSNMDGTEVVVVTTWLLFGTTIPNHPPIKVLQYPVHSTTTTTT